MVRIRCIEFNGNHTPSPFERELYAHLEKLEGLIRKLHVNSCGYTTNRLLGVSYIRFKEIVYDDYINKVVWIDPII